MAETFIPVGPEQEDPIKKDQAEKKLDDRTKDLLAKEKQFANHLAQNKNPIVQQLLKTWYQINVDSKNEYKKLYPNNSYTGRIKSSIELGSSVYGVMFVKHNMDVEMDEVFNYVSSYQVDTKGVKAMQLVCTDIKYSTMNQNNKTPKATERETILISIDIDGDIRVYLKNRVGTEVSSALTAETDVNHFDEIKASEKIKIQIMQQFIKQYQIRKKFLMKQTNEK